MALEKWLLERVSLAATEAADRVKQFALETIASAPDDVLTEIREGFACVGVWAMQNPLPIFKAMRSGKLLGLSHFR